MEVRSMLTGILSRRNTASHRYYTQLRALPLSLPHFVDFVRFLLSQGERKTGDTFSGTSCKKSLHMTSYGGIIRIRL